jgi:hypothetical protein
LNQKLKTLISQLSANAIFDLIEQIYEFKMKLDELIKPVNIIQQQLQDLISEDKQESNKQLSTMSNESEPDQNGDLENDIERLTKDIEQLELKFEEINNYSQKRVSQKQPSIPDINVQSDDPPEIMESPLFNIVSPNKINELRSDISTSGNSVTQETDGNTILSHLLVKQMSPSIIDVKEDELDLTESEDETHPEEEEEEEEIVEIIDSDTAPRINKKIHLSNNIVSVLRGPLKVMVDGTMHVVEGCAKEEQARKAIVRAVKQGLARQKRISMEQQTTNNSSEPTFTEITSKWKFEGENSDKGFSSASIWMRDPQGRRILVKTHELPLSAVNEWLAYVLGRQLGLPVNKVQIAIDQNNLVTLHTDVMKENEKTITFMDLPRRRRKKLLTDPIMECMDLFDRIIMNVDRNPRNILITISNTTDIDDDNAPLKIHLIDHGSSFGMGRLNGISVMASKLRTHHLSVCKFNPIREAKKFDRYLNKLPVQDRILIRKTLNRFAAITDNQIDTWLTKVEGLLSSSQYNRIYSLLQRQRDIAKSYTVQWDIYPRSSSLKSDERNQLLSKRESM